MVSGLFSRSHLTYAQNDRQLKNGTKNRIRFEKRLENVIADKKEVNFRLSNKKQFIITVINCHMGINESSHCEERKKGNFFGRTYEDSSN